ncbi:HAD family hydrolase [Nocardia bovistercoris]|uniref:HAD-IA family hydrolase n=1 Tax=Nocardia bovistercoris TaxID=2785916 RepID=A0A931IJS9_9NOCA|nr:HAD-IA family hydrolase [Nocardia bovistercoris]MBH0780873.1 HAD-IA family hydrolase [Nocardia bovistercoris]
MIDSLLVDAGGVLFNNILEETCFVGELARRHAADPDRLMSNLRDRAHRYESGERHVHDVLRDTLAAVDAAGADDFDGEGADRLYRACVRPYHENIAALEEVVRAHPRLTVVLANNEAEHWDDLKDADFGHYRHFDRLCSSWRMGRVKPSADYFAALLEHSGTRPERALMVDDRAAVIAAAEAMGMRTLHVRTPEVLCARLPAIVEALTSVRIR